MKPKLHIVADSVERARPPRDWRRIGRYAIGSVLLSAAAGASYWYFFMPHPATQSPYMMFALLTLAFVALKLVPYFHGVHIHHHHHRED